MIRNTDRVAKGVDGRLHIIDDEISRPPCDTHFRMANDGEEGKYCTICACRAVAKAIFMGYADQWHAEVLESIADRLKDGLDTKRGVRK